MNKIPQKWKTLLVKRKDGEIYKCYKNNYDAKIMENIQTKEKYQFCLDHIRNDKYYTLLEVQRGEKQTFYLYNDEQYKKAEEYQKKLESEYDKVEIIKSKVWLNTTIEGYNAVEKVA